MNLEDVMLSETSQSQRDKYYIYLYRCLETQNRMGVARGWGLEK
jgi:hypothetical protein